MKSSIGFITIIFCLTGCSEMRVIGNSAMREIRADGISVNWKKTEQVHLASLKMADEVQQLASVKERTFSSFQKSSKSSRKPVKGLWEKHGS